MSIENINNDEQKNNSNNDYTEIILQEIDNIVSKTYNIINEKKLNSINSTKKIEELNKLKWKVEKTIIRLWWHDITSMPNDYPWAPLGIILVLIYDFMQRIFNQDLSKLNYRLNNLNQLIKILKEKEDCWI